MASEYEGVAQKAAARPKMETIADLRKLTPDQVNENWDTISSILEAAAKGSVELRTQEAPATLADLKGKPPEYVNRHWQSVVKLLEAAAADAAAERKAKAQR